jgi:hypothetical protein
VHGRAEALRGTTEITSDLEIGLDGDTSFRDALAGHPLRAYHCTRLLDHETQDIRERGLRLLDNDLAASRLDGALASGAISPEEHDHLLANTVFAHRNSSGRLAQVCAVAGRDAFDEHVRGVWPLLSTWGGEAIYWAHDRKPMKERLARIGVPTIVVLDLDLDAPTPSRHLFFPDLEKVFVGVVLGLEGHSCDVFYHLGVPPTSIVDIWQPGHSEYDRHPELPRA